MSIKSKSCLSSAHGKSHGAAAVPGTKPHGASSGGTVDTIGEQEEEESLTKSEQQYIDKWSRRVDREEVYSTTYRPVPREERKSKICRLSLEFRVAAAVLRSRRAAAQVDSWTR